MDVDLIIAFLVVHTFADFVFQDAEWAVKKWHDEESLMKHVLCYTSIWALFIAFNMKGIEWYPDKLIFLVITFTVHYCTDFCSSKIMHEMALKKEWGTAIPNIGFFTILGFDQLIHFAQLFWTYNLFT